MTKNKSQKNIPDGWIVKNLGEIAAISRGGSPRPIEEYITKESDGLNWLRIGDIDLGDKYIFTTSQKIKKEGLSRTTFVKRGDFILSNSMSFGRPYIMKIDACIHDGWLALKEIKTNLISKDFLYYLLSSKKIQNDFVSISAGSGVQNLKKETVSCISVKLPLITEQKRIVAVLEVWDEMVEKLARKIEIKKNIKKGLMQELLSGKKRLAGFNKKWELFKLKELCVIKKGQQLNRDDMVADGIYPALNGGIEASGYTNEWNTEGKTITISEGGNSCGFINFNQEKFWCGGHCYAVSPNKNADKLFLYQVLKSKQNRIMSLRVGSGLPNIQKTSLDDLKILFPEDIKEQKAIADILVTADREIEKLEEKLRIIKEQKKFLLNNLITGQIRVPVGNE
jgi:type I restriction enzyme S subunit